MTGTGRIALPLTLRRWTLTKESSPDLSPKVGAFSFLWCCRLNVEPLAYARQVLYHQALVSAIKALSSFRRALFIQSTMVYRGSSSSLSLVEVTVVPINSKPVIEKQRLRRKEISRSVPLSSISTTKDIEEVIWGHLWQERA